MVKKKVRNKKETLRKYLFVGAILAYPLALFLLMYVYVNLNSFAMAFQKTNIDGSIYWVGLDNFKQFLSMVTSGTDILGISFTNSLKMFAINFVICMPLYIFFSYLLFKKVAGHKVFRILVMVPQVISSMVIALLFKKFVDEALPELMCNIFNLDSFPYLLDDKRYAFGTSLFYMIWVSFGVNVVVYTNAMNGIDKEIIESGQIDGLDDMFKELWYIILPLIYPTLTTFIITGFAVILTNGGPIMTFYYTGANDYMYNMGYYYNVQIIQGNTSSYNMLAAGGMIMTIIVAPLTHLLKTLMEKFGPGVE